MRLLQVGTFELVDFTLKRPIPEYGILSHTWGEEEVSLADLATPNRESLRGWTKVKHTCRLAREDGYAYVWIDTCCIDKSSSAELSEAINSMFAWYEQSAKCYVLLSDVNDHKVDKMMASRWWTRGWTLQELLAPRNLFFYSSDWNVIGPKQDYFEEINQVTGIPIEFSKANSI